MFKNIYYDTKSSIIHLWEQDKNGNNKYRSLMWTPYVFIKSDKGQTKSIDGTSAFKKTFKNYNDYYNFCNNHFTYENKVRPEIQFLSEQYYDIDEEDMYIPSLRIYSLDIEVHFEKAFPSPEKAEYPIVLISVNDSKTNKTITFGVKKYTGDMDVNFIYCKDERDLLKKFIKFIHNFPPDVITGYNVYNFDIPYIINRCKVLFDEDLFIKISPINKVKMWKAKGRFNKEVTNVDIGGITILDMHDLYRRYSPDKLESYKLDFVASHVLGKGKVDYSEYKDLRELYYENWDLYVEYNAIDSIRVQEIEEKLAYIKLVQAFSLITKVPMKYYDVQTSLIEGMLLTYYRRNNLCAPNLLGGSQKSYEAAFVKDPQPGKYYWVVDLDITSSYPSHIITLNMSPETYYGRILGISEDDIVKYTTSKIFPKFDLLKNDKIVTISGKKLKSFNTSIEKKILSIAPCGTVFNNKMLGIFPTIEMDLFLKRKQVKNMMIQNKENLAKDSSLEEIIKQQNAKQLALKVLLNSVYGITAVPYSRYFNTDIAEAITSCGRVTIKAGDKFANELMNDIENKSTKIVDIFNDIDSFQSNLTEKVDFVAYTDTDSIFLRMQDFILYHIKDENNWYDISDDKKIEYVLKISKEIEDYVNERVYNEVQKEWYNSDIDDFKITFKQEIVAKSILFVKKKKYAYWCLNEEGASVDNIKVTGLEIIRSDSSEALRERLRDIMNMILRDYDIKELRKKIDKYKKELRDFYPEEIAATVSVNNLDKYIKDGNSIKGTPWHVKGVANYRKLLETLNIKYDYEDIAEGIKVRVVYLKENKYGFDTITFLRWPKEFDKVVQIDYDKMIEKFFINKINSFLEPMNQSYLLYEDKEKVISLFFD